MDRLEGNKANRMMRDQRRQRWAAVESGQTDPIDICWHLRHVVEEDMEGRRSILLLLLSYNS